jgi:L-lysine exporter family protein LysE/ArgO
MLTAFTTGFLLGFSLILAIGSQNAFVLRQGIMRQHVFKVALFCAISDALLICIGVTGMSFFFSSSINQFSNLLFGITSIWISIYGFIKLRNVFKSSLKLEIENSSTKKLLPTITVLALLTFANPHVYLDTVILIGSISQQFSGGFKIAFTFGAILASFLFFFTLAYGARLLFPIMQKPMSWRILDFFIAIIMFSIAFNLAILGNLL